MLPSLVNSSQLVTPEDCTSNLVTIDDSNYRSIIDWFKECLLLSSELDDSQRDDYELGVICNVKNSLSEFFQRTELSLGTLIGLEREITSLFENFGSAGIEKVQQKKSKSCCGEHNYLPTWCELENALNILYRNFIFVVIASFILLLLLILVLGTLCWLRKCVMNDIKERLSKLQPAPVYPEYEEEEEDYYDDGDFYDYEDEYVGEYYDYYPAQTTRSPRRPFRRRPLLKKRVQFKSNPPSLQKADAPISILKSTNTPSEIQTTENQENEDNDSLQ